MDTELTPEEVAAMWIYGREYSQQSLGIVDWYREQSDSRKRVVCDFVEQMRAALAKDSVSTSR